MILVAFENENMRSQAVCLWQEAFGDSEEYINFFFANHSCFCLTECENEDLCSMLFLIEGELNNIKGYYLFAACTFEKYRKKGYMPRLLKKAEAYAKEQGRGFIALVPAEEWLFDYYEKYGYNLKFYAQRAEPEKEIDINRDICFKWCKAHEEYIRAESKKFGFEITEKNGMLFTVYSDGKIKIPADKVNEDNKFGMLLPVAPTTLDVFADNAYIGLTLDG